MDRYRWLERQLDRDDLSDEEFDLYNKEINDLQSKINQEKNRQKQERESARQLQISKLQDLIKEGKMQQVVDDFGKDYIDDYKITGDNDVLSFANNYHNPDQQKVWQCGTHEAAVKKIHMLVYWRIYNDFMRDKS